jgi:hypothetical protein
LRGPLRSIQQHIVPMGRVEIFNGLQLQPGGINFLFDGGELLEGPEPVRVAGQAPARVVADRLVPGLVAAGRPEIIHQVDDKMRAAALFGEAVMLRVELMAIKSQAEFHGPSIGETGPFGYPMNVLPGHRSTKPMTDRAVRKIIWRKMTNTR